MLCICNNTKQCDNKLCYHAKPHTEIYSCPEDICGHVNDKKVKCIPYIEDFIKEEEFKI